MRRATAAVATVAALALPGSALGALIDVNTTADVTGIDGSCSLREALEAANNDAATLDCPRTGISSPDTIRIPASASHYVLGAGDHEDLNVSGDLDVFDPVTIVGAGQGSTVIDGAGHDRVFDLHSGATELRDLTVTGGQTATPPAQGPGVDHSADADTPGTGPNGDIAEPGGGIRTVSTPLTLTRVTVAGNVAGDGGAAGAGGAAGDGTGAVGAASTGGHGTTGGKGGGVFATNADVTVIDSTISGNSAGDGGVGGAGGPAGDGDANGSGSGFNGGGSTGGNGGSGGGGGGIAFNSPTATLTIDGSTISGNTAGKAGKGGNGGAGGHGGGGVGADSGGQGGNSVGGASGFGGSGGGVSAIDVGTLHVSDTTLSGNTSGSGGPGGDGGQGGIAGGTLSGQGNGGDSFGGSAGIGGDGGGLYAVSETNADLTGVTASDNVSGDGGAGGDGGTGGSGAHAVATSFGNDGEAGGSAAGIELAGNGSASMTNSTVAQNNTGVGGDGGAGGAGPNGSTAGDGGRGGSYAGLLANGPAATITHVTVASNATGGGGMDGPVGSAGAGNISGSPGQFGIAGGLSALNGSADLSNSIVASNGGSDCAGNAFGPTTSGDITFPASNASGCPNDVVADPLLGPLQDNGGPTSTMELGAASPALGLVTSACAATDQRGVTRPKGAGCDSGALELSPPAAVTGGASALTTSGATVAGTVNPAQLATTYRFDFGENTAYGSHSGSTSAGNGDASVPASATLTGLKPNTTYHYRLVAVNGDATSLGSDATFKTAALPVDSFAGVVISAQTAKVSKKGKLSVKVTCPAGTPGGCKGKLTLKGKLKLKTKGKAKTVTLGSASFTIAAGKTAGVQVTLKKKLRKKLGKKLKATATAAASDGSGAIKTTTGTVTLKPAKKKSKKH